MTRHSSTCQTTKSVSITLPEFSKLLVGVGLVDLGWTNTFEVIDLKNPSKEDFNILS